jgi:hypothetical protein
MLQIDNSPEQAAQKRLNLYSKFKMLSSKLIKALA